MAKVTWLGEDRLHGEDVGGPSFTTWAGVRFPKGQPVDVTNAMAIRKAKANQYFKVEDVEGDPVDETPQPAQRRRGRPPKVTNDHQDAG